jgi:deazaflavin-dependent oxidoreductase (nitroreductase family)
VSDGGGRPRSLFWRIATPIAASRQVAWFYEHVAPRLDRRLIALTGGRFSTAGFGRVGVLRVRGAKSGELRETPLLCTRDGDRFVLIASRGGATRHPAWYRNVVANPDVTLTIDGGERPFRARTAEGDERRRLWELACRGYPGYAVYERRARDRVIPVVVLEPR